MLEYLLSLFFTFNLAAGAEDYVYKREASQKYPLQVARYKRQGPSFYVEEGCPPDCPRKVMILSLDGGGVKGVILARILEHIERMTGKPIHKLFDVIAGTSTGGIVATGITIPDPRNPRRSKHTARQIVELYGAEAKVIFKKNTSWSALWGLTGSIYDSQSFRGLSQHYCGADLTLSNLITPVVLTAYKASDRTPYFFSSLDFYEGKKDHFAWQATRASAAAPILFEAEYVDGHMLRDGGLLANNPSFMGYQEARKLFPNKPKKDFVILSLGTGYKAINDVKTQLGLRHVGEVVEDFIFAQMQRDEMGLRQKFGNNYIRIQTKLTERHAAIDNTAPENIQELISIADEVIESEKASFERLRGIWEKQGGKHVSSFDKWRELRLTVQEKFKMNPTDFTRVFFYGLCQKLNLNLIQSDNDNDDFTYEKFFERLTKIAI